MKAKAVGLLGSLILLLSCQKEFSREGGEQQFQVPAQWAFFHDSLFFSGPADSATIREVNGRKVLTVTGENPGNPSGDIILQVSGVAIGRGVFQYPDVFLQYAEGGVVRYQSIPAGSNLVIELTEVDSVSVRGVFSGTVEGPDGQPVPLTGGRFHAYLSSGTLAPEVETPPPPAEDYLPLYEVWTYGNIFAPETDTLRIRSDGDTTMPNDQTYKRFFNEATGETRYFRKEGSIYYEYLVAPPGGLLNFDPIEVIILRDDQPMDYSWESPAYDLVFNPGIPVNKVAKTVSMIVQRDFSETLNGKVYDNVIEVLTELRIANTAAGPFGSSGMSFRTLFAKGVGIIYYQDYISSDDWAIRHFITHD